MSDNLFSTAILASICAMSVAAAVSTIRSNPVPNAADVTHAAAAPQVLQFPTVTVTGRRPAAVALAAAAPQVLQFPTVTVTGRRPQADKDVSIASAN